MANKTPSPFEQFSTSSTTTIEVEALNGASVEIKKALTIGEQQIVDRITYRNQTVSANGALVPNHADFQEGKIKTVSLILVNPSYSVNELQAMYGAEKAINEIFVAFSQQNRGN